MASHFSAFGWSAICLLSFSVASSVGAPSTAGQRGSGAALPPARINPTGFSLDAPHAPPHLGNLAASTPQPTPPASPLSFIAPVYWSWGPIISADGRFVAFESSQANRDPGDTDWNIDVFVYDRLTGELTIVSRSRDGAPGGEFAEADSISGDGRSIAFSSRASNLVPDDTNHEWDVFLYNRETRETTRASVASDGRQGNGGSVGGALSADGKLLAFSSWATNFVGPDLNRQTDVFVRDLDTGYTALVSRASDGTPGNDVSDQAAISSDGHVVAFTSASTNLVGGDTNGTADVFVHDRSTGEVTRVSVASDGTQGNDRSSGPSLSADGRYAVFVSSATNFVSADTNRDSDVFVHDRLTGETTRVSVASDGEQANGGSESGSLSEDGRFVAFDSGAANLVAGDSNSISDEFVHDRQTGATVRISFAADGNQARIGSVWPSISGDGRYIAFYSADLGGVVVYDRYPDEPAAWLPTAMAPPTATRTPTTTAFPEAGLATTAAPAATPTELPPATSASSPPSDLGRLPCGSALLLPLASLGIAWAALRRRV